MSNENETTGNVAALREAVYNMGNAAAWVRDNCSDPTGQTQQHMDHIVGMSQAALSAPARNCDRMNVDDAFSAFSFMCDTTDCKDCPYKQYNKFGDRELCAMLFLYDNGNGGKEGGAE